MPMDETKTEAQLLQDKLVYKTRNAWEKLSEEEKSEISRFCEGYKDFLNNGKTEREFAHEVEKLARACGFKHIDEIADRNGKINAGAKVYRVVKKKSVILGVLGTKPLDDGMNIVGAHIDAPRIDIKSNPLYEDTELALLKTHYYGGIKKYQWVTIPLALHGIIVKCSGEAVNVVIGENEQDEVFTITDLLPHLAADQMQKKMSEAITGEGLNLLFGSIPFNGEKLSEKIKLNILDILRNRYGIVEEDFTSADLEIVPAFKARDVGIDRSMVGAYGQDDRVCAYPALKAILELSGTGRTAVCVLTDREEVGSMGNTGAQSSILESFTADLYSHSPYKYNEIKLRNCLENSKMLSADVNAGVDPNFEGVQDKRNASYISHGVVIQKYTGSRGKAGSSEASAEFMAELRNLLNSNNIAWQTAEIGKVDLGGGGTIAQYVANLGVEVVDTGVAVLSMHSPFEVTSKVDIYMNHRLYKAFMKG